MSNEGDRNTPTRPELPHAAVEVRVNGREREDKDEVARPYHTPRTPEQISANMAAEAKAAALQAAGMAGEMMGRASVLEATNKMLETSVSTTNARIDAFALVVAGLSNRFDRMSILLDGIAKAVGAKRTWSGDHVAVRASIPPPPVEIKSMRSPTGEHAVLERAELDRVVREWDMSRAREQATAEALAAAELKEVKRIASLAEKSTARRNNIIVACTVIGMVIGVLTFLAQGHISFH